MKDYYKLCATILALIIATTGLAFAAPNTGAIWTTNGDCGADTQDENHYSVGNTIYINGNGFKPGSYAWNIKGQPGHASTDPGQIVASKNYVVDSSGTFCIAAYVVAADDSGEYSVNFGKKNDNYRVMGEDLTCEEAIAAGLLTATIDGSTAYITNNAANKYKVSLVSYQMYSGGNVFDQTPFDWQTVNVGSKEKSATIDLPDCMYQLDLACGKPIMGAPQYDDRIIAYTMGNEGVTCTQSDASSGPEVSTTIAIAPDFPQDKNYVFTCEEEGFVATSYSWYFGDGDVQVASLPDNVYHTYAISGDYIAACRATDGTNWAVGTLSVSVE